MTRKSVFDAARSAGANFNAPGSIGMLDSVLDKLGVPRDSDGRKTMALINPAAFYSGIRKTLFAGSITQSQIDGIEAKLKAMGAAGWPVAFAAYGLATSLWETNKQMQPVIEAYYLGDKAGDKHRRSLRYYPWYGRGDVQLTWEANYDRADKELDLGGSLMANPDRMLEPDISARTMVRGMEEGWFTGKSLADYLPRSGTATLEAFQQARRIINGTDKASEIAKIAATFQSALIAGGWA